MRAVAATGVDGAGAELPGAALPCFQSRRCAIVVLLSRAESAALQGAQLGAPFGSYLERAAARAIAADGGPAGEGRLERLREDLARIDALGAQGAQPVDDEAARARSGLRALGSEHAAFEGANLCVCVCTSSEHACGKTFA